MVPEWELVLRLTLAATLGGVIGYERQSRRKSAGLRTNVLVCLGSCLIMILSDAIYSGVEGRTNADPARLAAQVVSGIGFLGAGAIMKEGLTVTGLTTAACLWVVAGVGLAVGGGFYVASLFTTALVFVTLGRLSKLDEWVMHERNLSVIIHTVDRPGQLIHISSCMEDLHLKIKGIKVKEVEDEATDLTDQKHLCIELDVYNRQSVKNVIVVGALKQLDGIISVDVI
ncbi:MAG: MgtC/SapB family protein [Selenomonadaceae bacterium]|nr:MgtC/SapB family protein [Selenomonadaceae bacterium]